MSGETETNVSGWTTDTLHSAMLSLIQQQEKRNEEIHNQMELRYEQRFEAQEEKRLDDRTYLEKIIADLKELKTHDMAQMELRYQQRYQTQQENHSAIIGQMELRYQQRFTAQQEAVNAALIAAEKAVTTALASADRAVVKAETAAEKRFECVSADTPILCANLIWRPAGDLIPGDELLAFDDERPTGGRRFRKSTVTANSTQMDDLFLVHTGRGDVRCNAEHPWLARTRHKKGWEWVHTDALQPTMEVMRIDDTIKENSPINSNYRAVAIISVENISNGMIASLTTSTGTYIAGGFAMHNSVNEFRQTLADQASALLTRAEADARFNATADKLSLIITQISNFVRRDEHQTLETSVAKIELELKGTSAATVRREDLKPITDNIDKLRDNQSVSGGKSQATAAFIATGLAVLAIVVALGVAIWSGSSSRVPPPVTGIITGSGVPDGLGTAHNQTSIETKLDSVIRDLEALQQRQK